MTEFGDELRRLLAQRGISLSAAAREAGCSKGYLSNAANGRKALTPRVAAGLDQLFGTGGTFAAYALSPPTDSNGTESACTQDAADPVNDGEGDLLSHAPEGVLAGGRTTSPSQPDPPRSADRDYQEDAEDVVHVLGRIQKLSKNINPDIIGRLHDWEDLDWERVRGVERPVARVDGQHVDARRQARPESDHSRLREARSR